MKLKKLISKNQPHNQLQLDQLEWESYPLGRVHIGKDEMVLDIGANVGGFYHAWKHKFHNWYLVEASTYNCEQLESNGYTGKYSKNAVGSKTGEILKLQAYKQNGNDTSSSSFGTTGFISEVTGDGWQGDYEEVIAISFEDVTEGKKIGLLKVDVEGAEYDFLMGAKLQNIPYVLVEIHNFLDIKLKSALIKSIEKTHKEIHSKGDGVNSHFIKLYEKR